MTIHDKAYFLYFIRCGSAKKGPVKIGISIEPNERIKLLQCGNPYKINFIRQFELNNRLEAFKIESILHREFKDIRMTGEWFEGSIKINKAFSIAGRFISDHKRYTSEELIIKSNSFFNSIEEPFQ